MLSLHEQQLIAAFVDGELSYRRRRATARLLHRSSEARSLLAELRDCAKKLRRLPPQKLPQSLASAVLSQIEQRKLEPQIPRPVVKLHVSRRIQYAVAASLLFFVVSLLYLNFRPALLTTGPIASGPLACFAPRLRLDFPDLAKEANRTLLVTMLRPGDAIHLDVRVKDQTAAIERLQDVLRDNGIRVLVNPGSEGDAKNEHPAGQFVVYAENIRPEELTKILDGLAATKGQTFEALALAPLANSDRVKLTTWIGAKNRDASALRTPSSERRGLFDPTIINKSDAGRNVAQADSAEQFALVFSSASGVDSLPESVQTFLANRQAQRPGTMQVLFVIHQA